jgi:hypothetical protein
MRGDLNTQGEVTEMHTMQADEIKDGRAQDKYVPTGIHGMHAHSNKNK